MTYEALYYVFYYVIVRYTQATIKTRCVYETGYNLRQYGMYVCMYVCVCMCVYVCMYVCMYCMYVCMYACMYVCMYTCMYASFCFFRKNTLSHIIVLLFPVQSMLCVAEPRICLSQASALSCHGLQ